MPEKRGQQYHRKRLTDAVRDELVAILEGELADPRVGLATVSEVELSPDGRVVHAGISVQGSAEDAARTMEGLEAAKGFIRHQIAERLSLRHPPDIFFRLDRSEEFGSRIDELLRRAKKRK
jgi:ribosome-binding factor A